MTYAPADLLAVRQFLLASTGLSGDAVGIVGDPAHMAGGGAHLGNDDLASIGKLNSDYTKRESPRDRPGTNAASAIDVGAWAGRRGPAQVTFLEFNARLVAACRNGDPRAADVREVIYTPDGRVVQRWDRLGKRSTGDSSHLYHTHVTRFRDAEGRAADDGNLLGLIKAIIEGDDVNAEQDMLLKGDAWRTHTIINDEERVPANASGSVAGQPNLLRARLVGLEAKVDQLLTAAVADAVRDAATKAVLDALAAGGTSVDTAAVIARINEVAAAESATVTALRAQVASLRADLAEAAHAAADAFDA